MKLAFSFFELFENSNDQIWILERLLKEDTALNKDDSALSILVGSFVKPLMLEKSCEDLSSDPYLKFTIEKVFPRTMNVLADEAPHIQDMC